MENGHNYSILSQIKFSELPREKVITLSYGKGDCMYLDENDSIKLIRELKSIENYWALEKIKTIDTSKEKLVGGYSEHGLWITSMKAV